MYVASLKEKTKRSCRINLQHLQDLNLIHLRIIGLISIWIRKTTQKKCKNRLGNSIRVGKLMRKWGDYQMGLLLLHSPYWIAFKRASKPEKSLQSHFINYSYQWEMFRKEKSIIKKFQWEFLLPMAFMSTILSSRQKCLLFITKREAGNESYWQLLFELQQWHIIVFLVVKHHSFTNKNQSLTLIQSNCVCLSILTSDCIQFGCENDLFNLSCEII